MDPLVRLPLVQPAFLSGTVANLAGGLHWSELVALWLALLGLNGIIVNHNTDLDIDLGTDITQIFFFIDNKSLLQRLHHGGPLPAIVWQLLATREEFMITFVHTLSHVGLPWNEVVDDLAKSSAAESPPPLPLLPRLTLPTRALPMASMQQILKSVSSPSGAPTAAASAASKRTPSSSGNLSKDQLQQQVSLLSQSGLSHESEIRQIRASIGFVVLFRVSEMKK